MRVSRPHITTSCVHKEHLHIFCLHMNLIASLSLCVHRNKKIMMKSFVLTCNMKGLKAPTVTKAIEIYLFLNEQTTTAFDTYLERVKIGVLIFKLSTERFLALYDVFSFFKYDYSSVKPAQRIALVYPIML